MMIKSLNLCRAINLDRNISSNTMNKILLTPFIFTAIGSTAASAADKPNIILILADDLGYSELGCYGNTFNETPNLDQLAQNGILFTNAYAAQTVSSPTRAALMTGLYPQRTGIVDYLRPDDTMHLDEAYTTLPEILQTNGYHTAIIGKWHLTGYTAAGAPYESSPDKHGFDETILSEKVGIGSGSYFYPYHFNEDVEKLLSSSEEFLVDRMNEEALRFIERQRSDRPFFLYLSHYAVHTFVHGKPEEVAYFRNKPNAGTSAPHRNNKHDDPYVKWPSDFRATHNNPHLASQLYSLDKGVGMIVEKLKQTGLYDNTLLIFVSDNGGETKVTSNAPLRDGKSYLYEGGVRVSMIVSAPGMVRQNVVVDEPFITFDLYPTLCDMSGIDTEGIQLDGRSFWPVWTGQKRSVGPRDLYWHYPLDKPHFLGGRSCGSIRSGRWKLLEFFDTGELELYDLENDLSEQHNLAKEKSRLVSKLHQKMKAWRQDVGAEIKGSPLDNTQP